MSIAVRWPKGPFEQNPGLVAELVSGNVDVLVAWATPSVIAARRATSTIPIVMVSIGDPLGSGFVASLARPGGNITGVSNITVDLSAKLVGLLIELVPGMKRVGVVHNPFNPNATMQLRQTEDIVRKLGLQVHVVEARTSEEYERAFAHLSAESVKGVVTTRGPLCHRTETEDCGGCAGGPATDRLSAPRECRGGRSPLVWSEHKQPVPPRGLLR